MITPSASPSSPHYAEVATQPANIQADSGLADVAAAFDESNRLNGQGVLYPQSERQRQTEILMQSPAGFGEQDIDAGSSFGWPSNIEPPDHDAS